MIVIVGAGVVGLACARALAMRGRAVCVLERHPRLGLETSTHNSGVIHAGLYYPAGSLKAALCLDGRDRLYDFCRRAGVPHMRCGKLIVAHDDELPALERLLVQARANGARLDPVDTGFAREREPYVSAPHALWSPDTGWVEAEALLAALAADLNRHDGIVLTGTSLLGVESGAGGGLVVVTERERIDAECLINAAGLWADEVARIAGGERFQIYPCRGEYAELAPAAREKVRGLVYPVPHVSGHGLGVHLTRTMGGAVWIGPTIAYQQDKSDYENGRLPVEAFLEPTRRLLPSVTLDQLRLSGSGIRPKLHPPTEPFADFMIRRDRANPYLIHAAGIDSPGLTACLAIGERVADLGQSG